MQAGVRRRLFSGETLRRSYVQFTASFAGGTDVLSRDGMLGHIALGVRLWDVFAIGGGARLSLDAPSSLPGRAQGWRQEPLGFFRVGLHLELDPTYRAAIPLTVDFGGGPGVRFHWKLNVGLRVRLWRHISVGLFLFNPTYTHIKGRPGSGVAERAWWSFPTTLELSYHF